MPHLSRGYREQLRDEYQNSKFVQDITLFIQVKHAMFQYTVVPYCSPCLDN